MRRREDAKAAISSVRLEADAADELMIGVEIMSLYALELGLDPPADPLEVGITDHIGHFP